MEWDESLFFALPTPALSGSGFVGMISALILLGTPLHKYRVKCKTDFRIKVNRVLEIFQN